MNAIPPNNNGAPPSQSSAQKATPRKPPRPPRANRADAVTERLLKDEHIVAQARISDGIYWRACGVFILALLVAFFIVVELGILLAVVSVMMAVYAIMLKEVLLIVVTNKRILARFGLLQVDIVDIHFDKVESMELKRMITGYAFGYSTVVIMGTGNRYISIPYVANGIEIRRAYNDQTLNHASEMPPQPVVIVGEKQA